MKQLLKTYLLICLILSSLNSCTEPYNLESNTFDEALVVEATITNELKKQEIKITHTYSLDATEPQIETGATVYIKDSNGNQFNFTEQNGVYISETEFEALPNIQYQLFIKTQQGKEYRSTNENLTTVNTISSIDTDVVVKDSKRGVQISVNSNDLTNSSKYYRYEYEETYQVIVPKWSPLKAVITNGNIPGSVDLILREGETRTCYSSKKNNNIILYNTLDLNQDQVVKFPIRFIEDDDYTIANRYSLLVRQFIQNPEAYNYYKKIKNLSESGEILSPNQPGFFFGNIQSVQDKKEKVIGFFDVASVSSKRIFFNYGDIFPNEPLPSYFNECNIREFDIFATGPNHANDGWEAFKFYIMSNRLIFYQNNGNIYSLVIPECGDCTSFSSNVIPPFWQ